MKAYLEPGEVEQLEQAAEFLRDKLLIRILFHSACRVSEALALEVKDIDSHRGVITIQHLKARLRIFCPQCGARLAKIHLYCPGCAAKVDKAIAREMEQQRLRTLPLDKDTLEMLKDYVERGGPISRNGKQLIFGINRHRAWQIIREAAQRAGLGELVNPETGKARGVSPHRLRDAFAVMAVKHDDSGDGLRLLQEHLGHASFNTTAKYRKVSGQEHKDWYESLWEEESHAGASNSNYQ